jgi:hypothetical protein
LRRWSKETRQMLDHLGQIRRGRAIPA